MPRFQPKKHTVDAVVFTEALGQAIAQEAATAAAQGRPQAHPSGVTFEAGRGYQLNGQPVTFGSYLVTAGGTTVPMPKSEFEATYEPKAGA